MRSTSVLGILLIASITLVQANIFERDSRQKFSYANRNGNIKSSVTNRNSNNNQPPILLDVMRQRYFSIEDALWSVINSGSDQTYALQQIHSGHQSFLRGDFLEKSCYFSTFDPEQRVLYDAIHQINQSVDITVENYLHSSRQFYRETDALAISARNLNLTHYFDRLIEVAGTSDFYATIRSVSDSHFCVCLFVSLLFVVAKFTHSHEYMLTNEHAQCSFYHALLLLSHISDARVHKKRTKITKLAAEQQWTEWNGTNGNT